MRFSPICAIVLIATATSAVLSATVEEQPPKPSTSAIAVFLGHWEGRGTFYDTKLSKAGTVKSKGDCEWSPQRGYMICEQTIIEDPGGTHGQLTVFAPMEKPDEVRYATLNGAAAPTSGVVSIHGNAWTFSGEHTRDGVTTKIRTTNTFEGDREKFQVEYSQDGGAHWTTMLDGEQHRVK
ncbi:MAG: hypothetical protein ROO76_05485 [Terriglobia bacterium]|jgi:hypothetical protein|nr:hypothetical protein [Terriglobia bacterium]